MAKYRFYGPATSHYGARYSNVVTVTVKAGITAVLSTATIAMDQTGASLAGKAFPAASGRTVYLQRYYSGTWHNMTYTYTEADGSYRFTLPTTTVGVNTYRVYMTRASASWPASITSTRTFTVLPWTSSLCGGYILAVSHVVETADTATVAGTITNQTGFDVQMSLERPIVEAVDTNGEGVRLFGDFYTTPESRTGNLSGVLHAGQSISYRGQPVTMQTPDRPWMVFPTWNTDSQFSYNVSVFCSQLSVPGVHILE